MKIRWVYVHDLTGHRRDDYLHSTDSSEQIVAKLRDADVMLNTGKDPAAVLQTLEISEKTYYRWRNQYDDMTSDEAKRLKELENENMRLD